jgi:nucleoside-diphosphate-sugar epimerase
MTIKVFILGATGYIGGSFLNLILNKEEYEVTALVRKTADAKILSQHGVKSVIGTLDDGEIIEDLSAEADVVFNFANCDHLTSAQAVVRGLQREGNNGGRKILIHTSGGGILIDWRKGDVRSNNVYSDLELEKIHAIPESNPHRHVDAFLFNNSVEYDLIIVSPPTVYGEGTGLFNRHSVQIPIIIRRALDAKKVTMVGPGLNAWNAVHVEDLADAYVLIFKAALEGKADVGKDGGFYFVADGNEYEAKSLNQHIANALFKKGVISDNSVTQISVEEDEKSVGILAWVNSSNSLGTADRIKKLGWKATRTGIWDTIEPEVELWTRKTLSSIVQ